MLLLVFVKVTIAKLFFKNFLFLVIAIFHAHEKLIVLFYSNFQMKSFAHLTTRTSLTLTYPRHRLLFVQGWAEQVWSRTPNGVGRTPWSRQSADARQPTLIKWWIIIWSEWSHLIDLGNVNFGKPFCTKANELPDWPIGGEKVMFVLFVVVFSSKNVPSKLTFSVKKLCVNIIFENQRTCSSFQTSCSFLLFANAFSGALHH